MNTLNKTIFPELVTTYFASSTALLATYTNFLSVNQLYIDQVKTSINFELADASCDFVTNNSNFFTSLNYKLSTYDNEFIDYWINQYNKSVNDIKNLVSTNIKKETFFQQYSDSIGLLTNSIFCLDDSTLSATSNIYPTVYPASIYSKLSQNTLNLAQYMSQKNTLLYRKNISNIQLTPDTQDISRVQYYTQPLTQLLLQNFDNISNIVTYYCTINNNSGYNSNNTAYNLQFIAPLDIELNVEGTMTSVDILGKKIRYARDNKTIASILGTNEVIPTNTVSINNNFISSTTKNTTNVNVLSSEFINESFTPSLSSQTSLANKVLNQPLSVGAVLKNTFTIGKTAYNLYNTFKRL